MIASRKFIRPLAPNRSCIRRLPPPSGTNVRCASSSPPGSMVGRIASFIVREGLILSGIAGVAGGSIALAGYLAERNTESQENRAAPLVGRRVLLPDGRRLHVRDSHGSINYTKVAAAESPNYAGSEASSNGAPHQAVRSGEADSETLTVVFEAGRGETLLEWEPVLRQLEQSLNLGQADGKKCVRLVSYSRSGLGLSDAPPVATTPLPFPLYGFMSAQGVGRTSDDIAQDLLQLFTALQVRGPVVLVASGVGGLHARVAAHHMQLAATNNSNSNGRSTAKTKEPLLAGLVLVEPVVEGVSNAHKQLVAQRVGEEQAEASLGAGLQQAALLDACIAKIGLTRMRVGVNKSAKRQADLLYGPPSSYGTAALSWTARGPHKETAYRELVGWARSEAQAASITALDGSQISPGPAAGSQMAQSTSSTTLPSKAMGNGLPVALITRGKRGELFGAFDGNKKQGGQGEQVRGDQASPGQKLSEAMELEWDGGLRRLARSLSAFGAATAAGLTANESSSRREATSSSAHNSNKGSSTVQINDVVLTAIEGGGNKLPLFFPAEVAAAVEAVAVQALENSAAPAKGQDSSAPSHTFLRDRLLAFTPRDSASITTVSGFKVLDTNTSEF